MFIVLLRFSKNRSLAAELMTAHGDWINQGLDEGVFELVGSLEPNLGGTIVASGCTRVELESRVLADPFVAHGVVKAEILEFTPKKANARLAFLLI